MRYSPLFGEVTDWDKIIDQSLDEYRSGRSLMDHLGADRLVDPALTGMLLGIRRGLIEETQASSMSDYVLVDMVVIAFANAMRVQSVIGNTALSIECEMFGQPTLRARWKKAYGGRPEDIQGLAVEEHVVRLRETLMPLAERFSRMAREGVEGLRRQRQMPTGEVERAAAIEISLVPAPAERGGCQVIEQARDVLTEPNAFLREHIRLFHRCAAFVARPVADDPTSLAAVIDAMRDRFAKLLPASTAAQRF